MMMKFVTFYCIKFLHEDLFSFMLVSKVKSETDYNFNEGTHTGEIFVEEGKSTREDDDEKDFLCLAVAKK
jgi:hypothetical protein